MTPSTASAFDPLDRAFLAEPQQQLSELREKHPVYFHEELDMWIVSRHEDIRAVFLDHSTFRPDNTLDAFTPPSFAVLKRLARAGFRLPPTLANNGGPNHPDLRRIATRFVGPSQIERALPLITQAAEHAVGTALPRLDAGECVDLVEAIARHVPSRVILALLGFDAVPIERFIPWSNAALELFWGRPSSERQHALAGEVIDFYRCLEDTFDARCGDADDESMFRALLHLDDRASRQEMIGACFFTLIAGQETTTQLLASSFHHLLLDPSRWAALRDDPTTAAGWVEDVLRREPPISTWRRVTTAPARVGNTDIPKGARVLLMIISAGSDPEVFDDPEQLCPHRENARDHLAFGLGRHRCPGAELARTEAEVTLDIAAAHLPPLQLLDPQPPMRELLSFRSPVCVWVEHAKPPSIDY